MRYSVDVMCVRRAGLGPYSETVSLQVEPGLLLPQGPQVNLFLLSSDQGRKYGTEANLRAGSHNFGSIGLRAAVSHVNANVCLSVCLPFAGDFVA